MNNTKQLALLAVVACSPQLIQAQAFAAVIEEIENAVDCSEFYMGTTEELSDVILDGVIAPDYAVPRLEFPQRDPHTFFIRGTVRLSDNPIVYSLREDGK